MITLSLRELFSWGLQTQIANSETRVSTVWPLKPTVLARSVRYDQKAKESRRTIHSFNKIINMMLLVNNIKLLIGSNRRKNCIRVIKPELIREDQRLLVYMKGKCNEKYE